MNDVYLIKSFVQEEYNFSVISCTHFQIGIGTRTYVHTNTEESAHFECELIRKNPCSCTYTKQINIEKEMCKFRMHIFSRRIISIGVALPMIDIYMYSMYINARAEKMCGSMCGLERRKEPKTMLCRFFTGFKQKKTVHRCL